MAFVIFFFAICGVAALIAAFGMGRFLWRDEQKISAVLVGSLTVMLGLFCLGAAWIWWEGPIF